MNFYYRLFWAAFFGFMSAITAAPAMGGARDKEKDKDPPMFSDRAGSLGAKTGSPPANSAALPEVEISGIVRLTGNAPFSELVISGSTGDWIIEEGERSLLDAYKQTAVLVRAKTYSIETIFPSGIKIIRRYLRNIELLRSGDGVR